MEIKGLACYLDGGSIEIHTDGDSFWIDNRLETTIKGQLYRGFPLADKSNMITLFDETRNEIKEALRNYKPTCDGWYSEEFTNNLKEDLLKSL